MSSERPRKQLRTSRACDFCHKRSTKCRLNSPDPTKCQNCFDFGITCTYDRPSKRGRAGVTGVSSSGSNQRRGSALQPAGVGTALVDRETQDRLGESTVPADDNLQVDIRRSTLNPSPGTSFSPTYPNELGPLHPAWRAFAASSSTVIEALIDVYHQIVYPIFPFFHQSTLFNKVRKREYLDDRACFASTMAACALASARARDGALLGYGRDASEIAEPPSETFFSAASDNIPKNLTLAKDFNYIRACALLSITSIQYGNIESMEMFLGHYFTILAIHRLHDETYWPKPMDNIEQEERRRLYWSIYTLDIYTSVVWNGPIHAYGASARVLYPVEVNDELITPSEILANPSTNTSWLQGWNFTTDLYVIMEKAVNEIRSSCNQGRGCIRATSNISSNETSPELVLQEIANSYSHLPAEFKTIPSATGDRDKDIFGFQSANIQATLQLLRMVFFSREKNAGVDQKCKVARELIAVFQSVPVAYLRAISTPLIHHLGGIGAILGSVMEEPLSEGSYLEVRSIL